MRDCARKISIRNSAAPCWSKAAICVEFPEAIDIFFDGKTELLLSAPFVKGIRTHGTGCTYSAAICAALALGNDLPRAVEIGKNFVTTAISEQLRNRKTRFCLGSFDSKIRRSQPEKLTRIRRWIEIDVLIVRDQSARGRLFVLQSGEVKFVADSTAKPAG